MNLVIRRLIAVLLGVLICAYGLFKIVMLMAFNGVWLLPPSTRENLMAFSRNTPDWHRYLFFTLLTALPIVSLELWRRGRRADRQIRAGEGLYIHESAVSGFLAEAAGQLPEVKSLTARLRMLRGKGLQIHCHVSVESRAQIAEIRDRIERLVRAAMAERLGLVPVAEVVITIGRLQADRATAELAGAAAISAPTPQRLPPQGSGGSAEKRGSLDLAPVDIDEEESPAPAPEHSSTLRPGAPEGIEERREERPELD